MNKLKPCPFCGEEDDIHPYDDEVICGSCGCHVGSMHKTKEINIDIWNTRVEAQAEIAEAWSAGHLSATTEDVELMDAMKEKHKAEIDELKTFIGMWMQYYPPDIMESAMILIKDHKGE